MTDADMLALVQSNFDRFATCEHVSDYRVPDQYEGDTNLWRSQEFFAGTRIFRRGFDLRHRDAEYVERFLRDCGFSLAADLYRYTLNRVRWSWREPLSVYRHGGEVIVEARVWIADEPL